MRRAPARATASWANLADRGRRDGRVDQALRVVFEDADRFTASIARDFSADGVARRARDLRRAHRGSIGQRHVPVEAGDEHGIIRGDRIDPFVVWQRSAPPQRVIPIATEDPFARLQVRGVLPQPAHELLWRRGVSQVDRRKLKPASDEMRVTVRQAGHDEAAMRLQDLSPGLHVARNLGGVADCENLAAGNRDRPGLPASSREAGPDPTALDHDVCPGATSAEQSQYNDARRTTHEGPPNGAW